MRRQLRPVLAVLACAALPLLGCREVEESSSEGYTPATLTPMKGTEVQRVTFTEEGARRVGLETAAARADGKLTVVPSASVLHDAAGKTFVYTAPKPLTFVRVEVRVKDGDDRTTQLIAGPPAGTLVVTTGATEVYGTEFEVDH
jgi:hypothetical protein